MALVRPPSFDLSDIILKSQIALVDREGSLLNVVPSTGQDWCVQVGAEEHRADLCFTQQQHSLAFPTASDLWDLICCCHLPLICEQAGMSLGERAGRGQRDA